MDDKLDLKQQKPEIPGREFRQKTGLPVLDPNGAPILSDMYGRGTFHKEDSEIEQQLKRFAVRALPTALKYAINVINDPKSYGAKHSDIIECIKLVERLAGKTPKLKEVVGRKLTDAELMAALSGPDKIP